MENSIFHNIHSGIRESLIAGSSGHLAMRAQALEDEKEGEFDVKCS